MQTSRLNWPITGKQKVNEVQSRNYLFCHFTIPLPPLKRELQKVSSCLFLTLEKTAKINR